MKNDINWRAEDTAAELEYRYQAERASELQPRWQALWLLRQGYPRQTVARFVGITPRTLRTWLAWYNNGGCAEVARHRLGAGNGQECRLTDDQLGELAAWAAFGQLETYDEACKWVADTWQVHYSYDGMRSLLNRIGIYPRVPRPLAVQTDLAAQEAWKKGGCVKRCLREKRLALHG
jgi:transposase